MRAIPTSFFLQAVLVHRAASYPSVMSEGEAKQAPAQTSAMEAKSEPAATGQGVSSVSPPVSTVTQAPPAPTTATEDEEEESEDESEILEESPCGRWQKRREEVTAAILINRSIINSEIIDEEAVKVYLCFIFLRSTRETFQA